MEVEGNNPEEVSLGGFLRKKRKALGLDKSQERVLYDMDMRRELDAV